MFLCAIQLSPKRETRNPQGVLAVICRFTGGFTTLVQPPANHKATLRVVKALSLYGIWFCCFTRYFLYCFFAQTLYVLPIHTGVCALLLGTPRHHICNLSDSILEVAFSEKKTVLQNSTVFLCYCWSVSRLPYLSLRPICPNRLTCPTRPS